VTHWLGRLKTGDPAAAQQLWQRYFKRLVDLAYRKLRGTPRRAADEEDVGLSAFDSFCRGAAEGRFLQLQDRDDLWQILVLLTTRKAIDQVQRERRQKRGGGRVQDEAVLAGLYALSTTDEGINQVLDPEPTPEFAAQVAEEIERLFARLEDESLRSVAQAKLEGYTNKEIADKLSCAERTVERKLGVIRKLWSAETTP
jgi:DNA-directed RNA polymerase specialized sigma24 family protein